MKIGIRINETRTSAVSGHMMAVERGLKKNGITVTRFDKRPPVGVDAIAVWGWRKGIFCRNSGFEGPILVVERGYIGDRERWTSLGWDGLNGRARHNGVFDEDRFKTHFGKDISHWKGGNNGYALLVGQVAGDMNLVDVHIHQWYKDTALALWKQGWDLVFRQHPVEVKRGYDRPHVPFARHQEGSLKDAFLGAALVVTYNSNTAVDAVMAGIPICVADEGSMVYGLASRDFNPIKPLREMRLNEIANVQWQMSELADGSAWEVVREAM